MKAFWKIALVLLLATFSTAAQQPVPPASNFVLPQSSVLHDSSGNWHYLQVNGSGNLLTATGGVTAFQAGQAAPPASQFVLPIAPVAQDVSGNWHYLQVDSNGNLLTSGSGGSGLTSVGLTVPSWLSTGATSPLVANGTIVVTPAAAQTSHQVIGTCGATTTFVPCTLAAGDIPVAAIPVAIPIGSVGSAGLSGAAPVTINAAGAIGCATCNTSNATVSNFSATATVAPLFTTSVATGTTTPALTITISNAGAGTVLGNATSSAAAPTYTSTPALGVSGTAGTLAMFPASGNFTTTWGSAATANNTILGFASAPATTDIITCVTSGSTCTLTDSGIAVASNKIAISAVGTSGLTGSAPVTISAAGAIGCATCVTSAGALTSTALMTGAGSQGSQTPSATSTLSAGGNMSLAGTLSATQLTSTIATGTAPIVVTSTTAVANLTLSLASQVPNLPLQQIISPTGAVATFALGVNVVTFNCATASAVNCFTLGETTAATTTGSVQAQVSTLTTSQAIALQITQGANGPANSNAPAVLKISAAAAGGLAGASNAGSVGAPISLLTGAGSAGGATTGIGGAGGAFTLTTGAGGAAGGTATNNGGSAGSITFTTGAGGNGGTGAATAGSGGNFVVSLGAPGTNSSTGTAGSVGQFQVTGTAPASTANAAGVPAGTVFSVLGIAGGASSNAAGTAGIGSVVSIATGPGGAGSGTNTIGGAGGALNLTTGNGGASTGNAANSNGGSIVLTVGIPGTGGSGTAGLLGSVLIPNTVAATVSIPQSSPILKLSGTDWTGAGASTAGSISIQYIPAVGLNQIALATFTLTDSSTNGNNGYNFPSGNGLYTNNTGGSYNVGLAGNRTGQFAGTALYIGAGGRGVAFYNNANLDAGSIISNMSLVASGGPIIGIGLGSGGQSNGFFKSSQTAQVVTSNYTTTGTTLAGAGVVTGLTFTGPVSQASNWSFRCDLVYSQATAAAADIFGVTTSGTAPTSMLVGGEVLTNNTGTQVDGNAVITSAASTTVVTATPSASGAIGTSADMFIAHIWGTVEAPSNATATTFGISVASGSSSDALTIYRGSACWVY